MAGAYGLKLTVEESNLTGYPDSVPLWIESSSVNVKQGQLIRIHGYVKVSGTNLVHEAFEIADSLSGQSLAVPVVSTSNWQPFTIYRAAIRDGDMKLTFSLKGAGVAMVDEVTVRTLDLSRVDEQASKGADIK